MATWDPTKPALNAPQLSADIRQNWGALGESLHGVNLFADPTFMIWSSASAPDHWQLRGSGDTGAPAGATLTRETGASNIKIAGQSCKLLGSSAGAAWLLQSLLPASPNGWTNYFRSVDFACGFHLKGSAASVARPFIYDGVGTSYSAAYNTGTSYEWLTASRTLDGSATKLQMGVEVPSNASPYTCYVDGCMAVLGIVVPDYFHPGRVIRSVIGIVYQGSLSGTPTTLNGMSYVFSRPAVMVNVRGLVGTYGSGTVTADFNKAGTSMLGGTKLQITSASVAEKAPDGATYADRCFGRTDKLTVDMDGAGTGCSDLNLFAEFLQWQRPLESLLSPSAVN